MYGDPIELFQFHIEVVVTCIPNGILLGNCSYFCSMVLEWHLMLVDHKLSYSTFFDFVLVGFGEFPC
jgi:hypothetical protein